MLCARLPIDYCIFDTLEVFSKYSGLKVNIDKSIVMWVGPWEDRTIPAQLNLTLAENLIDALGVTIGRKSDELLMKFFYRNIDKMISNFARWKFRPLTVIGKILITKTFGMSNLIYSMSILESSDDVLKKAQNAINNFIWGGPIARVTHKTLIAPYDLGGLCAPDLQSQNKALRLV